MDKFDKNFYSTKDMNPEHQFKRKLMFKTIADKGQLQKQIAMQNHINHLNNLNNLVLKTKVIKNVK